MASVLPAVLDIGLPQEVRARQFSLERNKLRSILQYYAITTESLTQWEEFELHQWLQREDSKVEYLVK